LFQSFIEGAQANRSASSGKSSSKNTKNDTAED
jgi:hypothetical protein